MRSNYRQSSAIVQVLLVGALAARTSALAAAQTCVTGRVSLARYAFPRQPASFPSISLDGRRVVFACFDDGLVVGDNNLAWDVFVSDSDTLRTTGVSVGADGTYGQGDVLLATISGNGRFVVFISSRTGQVPSYAGFGDVFVRDLEAQTTQLISVSTTGIAAGGVSTVASISDDGRFVAFASYSPTLVVGDTNGATDVFVRDRQTNTTVRASQSAGGVEANSDSYGPALSGDGTHLTFVTRATNLVPFAVNQEQVVSVDLVSHAMTLVSINTSGGGALGGGFAPSVSQDGRLVVFQSYSPDLVPNDTTPFSLDVFSRDILSGITSIVSLDSSGAQIAGPSDAIVSRDATRVAFSTQAAGIVAGDTNGASDVYVRDLAASTTLLVSSSAGGMVGNLVCTSPFA